MNMYRAGGDIHAVDRLHESETLLIAATTTRRADLARYLLSRGVNVNQALSGRGSGKTALHEACLPEIARLNRRRRRAPSSSSHHSLSTMAATYIGKKNPEMVEAVKEDIAYFGAAIVV